MVWHRKRWTNCTFVGQYCQADSKLWHRRGRMKCKSVAQDCQKNPDIGMIQKLPGRFLIMSQKKVNEMLIRSTKLPGWSRNVTEKVNEMHNHSTTQIWGSICIAGTTRLGFIWNMTPEKVNKSKSQHARTTRLGSSWNVTQLKVNKSESQYASLVQRG
jgi:hypothetical protein